MKFKSSRSRRNGVGPGTPADSAVLYRSPREVIYPMERSWSYSLPKAIGDTGYALSFKLADLPDFTEFTNLFDQYRLSHVELMFTLQTPNVSGTFPTVLYAQDHDDEVAPTRGGMLSKSGVETLAFSSQKVQFKRVIRPSLATAVYNTALTSGYARTPATWIDSANSSVPHYGVKLWIDGYNSTSTPNTSLIVYIRYYVQGRALI